MYKMIYLLLCKLIGNFDYNFEFRILKRGIVHDASDEFSS